MLGRASWVDMLYLLFKVTGIPATEFATLAETAKAPVDWTEPISAVQAEAVRDSVLVRRSQT